MGTDYFYMIVACLIVIAVWLFITGFIIIAQEIRLNKLELDLLKLKKEIEWKQ